MYMPVSLDLHGDHLLGCGQGPLHIHRHNALCHILYHTLSQDNPDVWQEQCISGDNKEHTGNIFHLDFTDGHPSYFDNAVRNTLQPGNLNQASLNVGATTVAGEMEKDQKHVGNVEQAGGCFYPLVMETLVVWTAFSLSILRIIAGHTTVRNGVTVTMATRKLIKQLSVKC